MLFVSHSESGLIEQMWTGICFSDEDMHHTSLNLMDCLGGSRPSCLSLQAVFLAMLWIGAFGSQPFAALPTHLMSYGSQLCHLVPAEGKLWATLHIMDHESWTFVWLDFGHKMLTVVQRCRWSQLWENVLETPRNILFWWPASISCVLCITSMSYDSLGNLSKDCSPVPISTSHSLSDSASLWFHLDPDFCHLCCGIQSTHSHSIICTVWSLRSHRWRFLSGKVERALSYNCTDARLIKK